MTVRDFGAISDTSAEAAQKEEHWIPVDDGISLHATVYHPHDSDRGTRLPAITLAHGFGGIAEMGLTRFAEHFCSLGFVVIVHDHRSFGRSGGWPRQDVDPWRQIYDWRQVITYLCALPGVDPERIGVWGSSFAGGHVLVLAGSDFRVKAVVSQIPTISGWEQGLRRGTRDQRRALQERFNADEHDRQRGAEPTRQLLNDPDEDTPSAYSDPDMEKFEAGFTVDPLTRFDRQVTLRSTLKATMYDPGVWVPRISPTPLLMVVGTEDTVTPFDLASTAYEAAGEPKKFVTFPGGHFDAYEANFAITGVSAGEWFVQHLMPGRPHAPLTTDFEGLSR